MLERISCGVCRDAEVNFFDGSVKANDQGNPHGQAADERQTFGEPNDIQQPKTAACPCRVDRLVGRSFAVRLTVQVPKRLRSPTDHQTASFVFVSPSDATDIQFAGRTSEVVVLLFRDRVANSLTTARQTVA